MKFYKIQIYSRRVFHFLSSHPSAIFLIILIIVFLDLSETGFLSKYLTNDEGRFDNVILWSAIGSISTTSAVFIALFQFNIQNSKKVKISFNQVTLVGDGYAPRKIMQLSIVNHGLRNVKIASWRFVVKGDQHFLVFPTDAFGISVTLPVSIDSEESCDLYFPVEKFKQLMNQNYDINKKLKTFVVDSVGDRYYFKTENKIKNLID